MSVFKRFFVLLVFLPFSAFAYTLNSTTQQADGSYVFDYTFTSGSVTGETYVQVFPTTVIGTQTVSCTTDTPCPNAVYTDGTLIDPGSQVVNVYPQSPTDYSTYANALATVKESNWDAAIASR